MKRAERTWLLAVTIVWIPLAAGGHALAAPSRGQAGRVIREAGILKPATSHTIYCQMPGPVAVLYVAPEGKVVEKGDRLVELDSATLDEERAEVRAQLSEASVQLEIAEEARPTASEEAGGAVELAEQGLHVAKLALDVFVEGEYPLQVAEAEDAVMLAQERQILVTERLAWLKAAEDGTDSDQLAQAKLAVGEAEAQQKAAEGRLRLLEDVVSEYKKAALRLAIMERQFALMRARNERQRAVRDAERAVRDARTRMETLRMRQRHLDREISECKLCTSRAGTVHYVRQPWPGSSTGTPIVRGSIVRKGQPLVEVFDTQRFKLAVPVAWTVAQQVKTGREVSVRVDAVPNETFMGRVAEMRVVFQPSAGAAQPVLIVTLENTSGQFRSGMLANVEFEL